MLDPPRSPLDLQRLFTWLMGATNLIILTSPVTEVMRGERVRKVFRHLAVGAVHLNVFAAIMYAAVLSYGYLVWLASFVLLARTLWRDRPLPRPF